MGYGLFGNDNGAMNAPLHLPSAHALATLQGVARLEHLGVIRVLGADAAKFIHNQLSQDFSLLGLQEARLAAYCTAQGRMLASFIGFKRSATELLLICDKELLTPTLKRLSMFVLRAQAKLSDASAEFALYGLAGAAVQGESSPPWALHPSATASCINLYPAHGVARQLWLGAADAPAPEGPVLAPDLWLWGEVMGGVATLNAKVVEAFVPQMLNFESIGGVNFKKGCYPGQEVVARSQFRGTLKRRAFLLHGATKMSAGDAILGGAAASDVGTVVQVAASPDGGFDAIGVLQLHALQEGPLLAGTPTPATLSLITLPYALLEDI